MDITVQAFELEIGPRITMQMLYDHLLSAAATPVDGRFLYVDRFDGWWRGLLLTARNIKAFARMERDEGRIRLSPEAIANGELAHFNFFLMHEERRRGLFQYYHGAASIHGFGGILKHQYNALKNQLISQACRAAGEDPEKPPAKIKRRYAGFLNLQLVLRRESFEDLVRNLRAVSKVSIQFKEYQPNERLFRSLAEKSKVVKHTLTFRDKYEGSLRDDIIELARSDMLKDLRGVGIEEGDVERRFRLLNEPESLGRFDFNDVVLETEFDSNDVRSSLQRAPLLTRLADIAQADDWLMGSI
jgi:hypothetical protein